MIRSILLALDDTPGSDAARLWTGNLAARCGARVTGLVLLDRRHLFDPAHPEHGPADLLERAHARAETVLAALRHDIPGAAAECLDAPEGRLRHETHGHDLLVIGTDAAVNGNALEDGISPRLGRLVRDGSRPVLAVPPGAPRTGPVLVAYDGSVPCQRSLHMAVLLGLLDGQSVHIVSVADQAAQGAALACQAHQLLGPHGITAETRGLQAEHPVEAVMAEAGRLGAAMLVIGAFAHGHSLRARGTQSATARLLRDAPCAVFLHR